MSDIHPDLTELDRPEKSLEELLKDQLDLVQQWTTTNDVDLLLALIQIQRQLFTFRPVGHPSRHIACYNLAFSLRKLYNVRFDDPLIVEAIDLHRESLDLRPPGHPLRGISCVYLASNLSELYTSTGNVHFLEEAVDLNQEALAYHPKGHPARPLNCFNLAACLTKSYERNGNEEVSDQALAFGREALTLLPDAHPEQAMFRRNLASELISRFNHTNKEAYIDEAVELNRYALSLCPAGHPERGLACINLASSLRHQSRGSKEELLALSREALSLSYGGDPHRATFCSSLSTYLHELYEDTGNNKFLFESIEKGRQAVSLRSPGHPDWAMACSDLAKLLSRCYDCTGDNAMLQESLSLDLDALEIFGTGHPYRVTILSNFASNLERHFLHSKDQDALKDAMRFNREVLSMLPEGHSDRGGATLRLAASVRTLATTTCDDALADEAMGLWRKSLILCPAGHPLYTTCVLSYASGLNELYSRKGNEEDLKKAISALQQLLPSHCNSLTFISLSLSFAQLHLHPASAYYAPEVAISHLKASLNPDMYQPLWSWRTASRILQALTVISSILQSHAVDLLHIHSLLINMLPLLVNYTLTRKLQLNVLRKTRMLGSEAVRVALYAEEEAKGLELLEHTRGLMWSQALSLRDADIERLPADLAHEVTRLIRDISLAHEIGDCNLETSSVMSAASQRMVSARRDRLHQQAGLLQECLRKIRSMPDLGGFMSGMSYNQLRQCAVDHPVVILLSTTEGSHALVIKSSEDDRPSVLPLPITLRELHNVAMFFYATLSQQPDRRGVTEADRGMALAIKRKGPYLGKLEMLWHRLVQPILKFLSLVDVGTKKRGRIHWCTTGDFMFLPIHAAGVYQGNDAECCMDYVVSSYTPTISALLRAASDRRALTRESLSLLLVAEPKGALPGLPTLFSVGGELNQITSAAQSVNVSAVTVKHGGTTKEEVCDALKMAQIVHLACHGVQDPIDALTSGFCLGDGTMTVTDIMNLKLGDAFLAFLSACETAKGDEKQPDDVVHLATAMLFSGFRSVVATMWAMSDSDGPVVAEEFYRNLLSHEVIDYNAVPFALDAAVSRLRKQGVSPERWATFIHVGA